jgi:antitoxin (DNA-binding transcriptional repressor) of toxin-antitoxin stability system
MVVLNDWLLEMTMKHEIITVTDFKARCLELFDRLSDGSLDEIEVTRRGKRVAIVTAPPTAEAEARSLHGSMLGMTRIAPGVDLTEPVFDEEFEAAEGLS